MASKRGDIKLIAIAIVLVIGCVLAYFVLLDLVRPHPASTGHPVPSDLPPGAQVYDGGYYTTPYNTSQPTPDGGYVVSFITPNTSGGGIAVVPVSEANLTPDGAGYVDTSGTDREVSFFELPLWIQLYALPGILFGMAVSFFAAALVVRRARKSHNPNQREVYTYIADNPGCTAPEVARDSDMNIGTVRYHIQRLHDEGRIALRKIGKYTRIFVNAHTYDELEKVVAAHLRNDTSRLILGIIMDTPGISNQKISEKLGMEKSLAYRYIKRLNEDGIISFEWEGKNKLYYISQDAKEPLIKLMPRNYQCPGLMKE